MSEITKNQDGQFEAFVDGYLLDVFPTEAEAKAAIADQEKDDKEFEENLAE